MDLSTDKFLNWPPFYTYFFLSLQPNTDTRQQQLKVWSEVILTHCKNSKLYITTIDDFREVTRNTSINRYLNEDFLRNLFEYMKNEGSCVFEGDTMLMFWKRKEAYGEQVYKWAIDNGKVGSVETVLSLVEGDETMREEFYGVPVNYMLQILKSLEKSRKCEMFLVGNDYCVKFF